MWPRAFLKLLQILCVVGAHCRQGGRVDQTAHKEEAYDSDDGSDEGSDGDKED